MSDISKIEIQQIKVAKRIRAEFGDIEDLASSISRLGLLQPIVLDENNHLIAGGRRLAACMHLGWTEIPFLRNTTLADQGKMEAELEENIKRKDLEWPEEVLGLLALFNHKQERYGKRGTTAGEITGYGVEDAAKSLDRSVGGVSMDLQLARGLAEYPELAAEKSKVAA